MKKKVDYLIVGQGLAGSFLAFQLLKNKKSFLILDKEVENSSSKVAAGLINPVALRRLIPTWRADEFLTYNSSFFSQIEALLNKEYYFELTLEKLMGSKQEEAFWQKKAPSEGIKHLVDENISPVNHSIMSLSASHAGKVKKAFWLNINHLLEDFRHYLKNNDKIIEERFDYSMCKLESYKDIFFNKIIFSEGAGIQHNPFFNHLPYRLNKGELITIRSKEYKSDNIVKKRMFVLPVGSNTYKVGATYAWEWDNLSPEKKQKKAIENGFREISKAHYEVQNHQAALRPSVKDRRPLMGQHHERKSYFIFNGMGSRGCLIAPKLSEEMYEFMELNFALHDETNIDRFNKRPMPDSSA